MAKEFTSPPRSNWKLYQSNQQGLYALSILSTDSSLFLSGGSTGDSSFSFAGFDYIFNLHPKAISTDEPAAVLVTPTQDGGQFIEHQGQIYKNISISGTTGLRPFPVVRVGEGLSLETGLSNSEKTGFDRLIELKNFFQAYYEAKRDINVAHKVVMVWGDSKNGEFYIVEPMSFKTSRESSSPLTTSYEIVLRTISRIEAHKTFWRIPDPQAAKNSPIGFRDRLKSYRSDLNRVLFRIDALSREGLSSAVRLFSDIIAPANQILNTLTGIANVGVSLRYIPEDSLRVLSRNAISTLEALAQASSSLYITQGVIQVRDRIQRALWGLSRLVAAVAGEDQLSSSPQGSIISAKNHLFTKNNTQRQIGTGGDPSSISNQFIGNSAAEATIAVGETIQNIANRLLGNSARWKSLVFLNKLKAPYISPDGDGVSVLRPGDRMLFPTSSASVGSSIGRSVSAKFNDVGALESRLGRDLNLESRGLDGILDLSVDSASGDLKILSGTANIEQAMFVKFSTEQGELPLHPSYGIRFPVGVKQPSLSSINLFQIIARASLLSDSRILDVEDFNISYTGNTLSLQANVRVIGTDQAVSLDFGVRR